jgi:hypothetical protein
MFSAILNPKKGLLTELNDLCKDVIKESVKTQNLVKTNGVALNKVKKKKPIVIINQ